MPETLALREGYFGDPAAFQALADLLQDIFGIDISHQMALGGPDPTSMPFGYFNPSGRCVANFSAFSMPLVVNGRVVRAAGYQSGAVRPDYRGQGLYRALMQRAFDWAEREGFEAGILLTDKPGLYEPYGFRTVPQFKFQGAVPHTDSSVPRARDLDLKQEADLHIVQMALEARQPVSEIFSVVRQKEMFLLNAHFDPDIRLSLLEEDDAVIAWKPQGDTSLEILDVAARHIPPLGHIVASLGAHFERAEVFFPTDRLGWDGMATPYQGDCVLMVKGLEPASLGKPFMLSPLADF
ncbi:GNAT superfamily N-acetyltransferase [Peteryoungia aggregata LMG 23059]|uniref:GNAT superfamily N-acetyltransferase n=1 Tax=Peteryoungia aggregata LMG 23059 TaxID=1368425 RepID=A0ABU0G602_9HYPH|nr:GNAT family N-acetyltransferase [Peteryoungia aggregata]MDQ0420112.1 GNAT superfamily N-acetyltransferase [Peteryoungia aggregata LMG 23059]